MGDSNIRVCLKCKSYIIVTENYEGQKRLAKFDSDHAKHTLITTKYSEIDNLECGKVQCEDTDERQKYDYVR